MGQRGERAMFPEAPAAANAGASEAGVEARPVDAIMDRYARGDDAALDELYRLCASRVRGFLARLCANLSLADDLTQDAFLRIHSARGTFVAGAPALPWMFAIARNSYLDHLRREAGASRTPDDDGAPRDRARGSICPPTAATAPPSHGRCSASCSRRS